MRNAVSITPWNDEEHIVSVVVHVRPEHCAAAEQAMDQLTGVERITNDPAGKYVVIISAPTAREALIQIETIQAFEGVLSAAMVAHHTENCESLDQEIEMSDVLLAQNEEQNKNRRIQ